MSSLVPAVGAWVRPRSEPSGDVGVVTGANESERGVFVSVEWMRSRTRDVVPMQSVVCGLQEHFDVLHVPSNPHEESLGEGVVQAIRELGGHTQVLVDFVATGSRIWMPWQRLRFVKGARFRFRSGDRGGPDSAERFRLRTLAHALALWNENTGALSHFDIDPLPHQIHLVHHILSSGNLNWLIADDVGLGKTIEAGLLIAALRQREVARRILLVVPAGLTRQWQEDLKYKFGLDDFLIYGADFQVNDSRHWKLYDRVIASLDKAKGEVHLDKLFAAEPWDLVIFDEAHRLTRRQYGRKYEKSERFKLAEALRKRTRNLLMLTATPHQGDQSQFQALLETLRPELKQEIRTMGLDPSVLSRMVFRNRKSDVTDIEGNFVFHGQTSKMVQVDASDELKELESQLRSYLTRGYEAARRSGRQEGRAIGFVMTVYRKLAASSIRALELALTRRLARLSTGIAPVADDDLEDERYAGEEEERQAHNLEFREEFFSGEMERLKTLIEMCRAPGEDDDKLHSFLESVLAPIIARNPQEKVLVFTEYRGTQDYLVAQLEARFGADKVDVIHGGMDVDERRASIARFESEGQFLVSTEAGGEGLNLHRHCHILVNYDLPWNPMRLAQRIGRLYRYGQTQHVIAFNIQGVNSADDRVVANMYSRLEQVAADMAAVDDAPSDVLVAEIVGELASLLDVEEILEAAGVTDVARTEERIEEALRRAQETSDLQRKLFQHAVSYDADEMRSGFSMGSGHLQSFVHGMVRLLGGRVSDSRKFPGKAWLLELPESADLPRAGREGRVTFERDLDAGPTDVQVLDMDHPFVRAMLERARSYDFQGLSACAEIKGLGELVTAMLRWQDDRGRRLRQEFVALARTPDGEMVVNPGVVSDWLRSGADTPRLEPDQAATSAACKEFEQAIDRLLAQRSNANLLPDSAEWLSAAWCAPLTEPAGGGSTSKAGAVAHA